MIILLSPSKGQDFAPSPFDQYSQAVLLSQSKKLVSKLKTFKPSQLQQLMSISEKLAELNYQRFQDFETPFKLGTAKQAVLAFKGDVYTGLEAETLTMEDLDFAQHHLRILSGLYGYLKPLDLIMPYRLEMKTRLSNEKGENLYHFWDKQITGLLNEDLNNDDDFVVNLASNEYFKAIKKPKVKAQILTLHFKDTKAGKTRVIGFFAKKARGMMAKALIQNKINHPEVIKSVVIDGYQYNDSLSKGNDWVFERAQPEPKT
ncbi:MAG: peroxide stress protein YaaA [Marinicella sp.]